MLRCGAQAINRLKLGEKMVSFNQSSVLLSLNFGSAIVFRTDANCHDMIFILFYFFILFLSLFQLVVCLFHIFFPHNFMQIIARIAKKKKKDL